jgi:hypothetical protein
VIAPLVSSNSSYFDQSLEVSKKREKNKKNLETFWSSIKYLKFQK